MNTTDWRWKIAEATERIRTRYHHIGRKTGAPFLALVYPAEAEVAVLAEWTAQAKGLAEEFDVQTVDVLAETQAVLADIGAENVVAALADPMPSSDPEAELGHLFVRATAGAVGRALAAAGPRKPVAVLARTAALFPAAGPRDVMQALWDAVPSPVDGPVVVLIPGTLRGPRTYSFLDRRDEFMYRGDLL